MCYISQSLLALIASCLIARYTKVKLPLICISLNKGKLNCSFTNTDIIIVIGMQMWICAYFVILSIINNFIAFAADKCLLYTVVWYCTEKLRSFTGIFSLFFFYFLIFCFFDKFYLDKRILLSYILAKATSDGNEWDLLSMQKKFMEYSNFCITTCIRLKRLVSE